MTAFSFYAQQSEARKIATTEDVVRLARESNTVFNRILVPFLPSNKTATIYEAATGPGIFQAWLCDMGYPNREGSDFSEKEVLLARHFTPSIKHADALVDLRERFSPDSIQMILAFDFFEHLPRESFRDFLKIAHQKLTPNGWLVMRGPNADSPLVGLNLYNDITHVWAYTTTCLRVLCRLEGFRDIRFCDDAIPGIHSGALWKKPLMKLTQGFFKQLFWMASRQKVLYWGSSIYLFAKKDLIP